MSSSSCLNCGKLQEPGFTFCPGCGQKASTHRLSFHDLSHDAIHYFTHADKGIFMLLKELMSKPGIVAREYVEGRRTHYFKPLNFFLLVAAVLVLATGFLYTEGNSRSRAFENRAGTAVKPHEKAAFEKASDRVRNVNKITGKYSNVINMLATPFITFLFWLFYRKGRYNYIEHLVANMYFVAFTMLVYSLVVAPLAYLVVNPRLDYLILGLFFLFEILYRGFAYYHFMAKPGKGQLARAIAISTVNTLIWIMLTFTLISTYIRTGFYGLME